MRSQKRRTRTAGRPRIEVSDRDLRQVESMARLGMREDEMAVVLGWGRSTFHRRKQDTPALRAALERGRATAALLVAQKLWQAVMAGQGWAIRWYEMTRLGYRPGMQLAGPGGGPIPLEDVSTLAPAERRARIQQLLDLGQRRAEYGVAADDGLDDADDEPGAAR